MSSVSEGRFPSSSVPSITRTPRRTTLLTGDGVRIEAVYTPCTAGSGSAGGGASGETAVVLAHGFTGSVDRPALLRAAEVFAQRAAVITFSFRGHGRSGGRSTVGDREVLDLAAAVAWARSLGHRRIVTVGFSMGGSVVLRHAALYTAPEAGEFTGEESGTSGAERVGSRSGPRAEAHTAHTAHEGRVTAHIGAHTDAVVSVSAPARWYYRGTAPMRRLHWVVTRPTGRLVGRYGFRTRIHREDWNPVPLSPVEAVPLITAPLLIVHGDRDPYFPVDHPRMLAGAAGDGAELWLEHGMGHAENAADEGLLSRIADWTDSA
ncbi:Pimeloyl-ACP methyl ester carboxylesterase [Streptomyces sp. LamerLS-316]|uniref:alpha/beta hydrolase n=1 Tax=unclassified Streptomyces TaxID=2593676 RepID=UPI000823CD17|nr:MULTISPECIES: alpha/beta hydrolase [unclassified Streptomyces]MYQ43184.1 alpha/beta fold hydrolase [Streptomyces sp. SID4921]SCK35170.1 Pimeloyl-ACP methyl ester carboxylesterase [Streptomyces sp. LamerLS-316]